MHFLGLLELYKRGLVALEQAATFGELLVVWTGDPAAASDAVWDGRDTGHIGDELAESRGSAARRRRYLPTSPTSTAGEPR